MRPSITQAPQGRASLGKIVLALTVAAVLGGLAPGPALSDDHDRRDRDQKRSHRVYRPAPRYSQPYGYAQPYGYYYPTPPVVYAPPPVVYAPPPSPGISLFFGFPIRIR
jgi:hypothetical protein